MDWEIRRARKNEKGKNRGDGHLDRRVCSPAGASVRGRQQRAMTSFSSRGDHEPAVAEAISYTRRIAFFGRRKNARLRRNVQLRGDRRDVSAKPRWSRIVDRVACL